MVLALVLASGLVAAGVAVAGELVVRNVTTTTYGEWTHTGPDLLLLKAVQSGATGGVLTVYHDMMIGGAGVTKRTLATAQTVTVSRAVQGLPSDVYVLPGQKITLTNTTAIASHTVFLILEKQE
jgi:hypothetical protein